jgi:restriction system protein
MRAIITIRELLDTIIEEVAIRTGILLNDHDVINIFASSPMKEWKAIFGDSPDQVIGVRPEFVEDIVLVIRVGLGNLPDATRASFAFFDRIGKFYDSGYNITLILETLSSLALKRNNKLIDAGVVEEVAKITKAPIALIEELVLAYGEYLDRSLSTWLKIDVKPWDGIIPLSKLFEGEVIPKNPETYLDQRFLDYLAANEGRLDEIHWRNFERLCAEFFSRHNYIVQLGKGRADGGVDLRVWPGEYARQGPPLLLVQCKRYRGRKVVTVEYVKALWADVEFEKAQLGLLATTSTVAPGGKRICQARKWPLSFAEHEQVVKFVRSMWRHAWQGRVRTKGLGVYLLPPIVPFGKG